MIIVAKPYIYNIKFIPGGYLPLLLGYKHVLNHEILAKRNLIPSILKTIEKSSELKKVLN